MKTTGLLNRISGKWRSFLNALSSPIQDHDVLRVIFRVQREMLSASAQKALNSHIQLWQLAGCQVTIEPPREQIPQGCIGIEDHYHGEKRVWRAYLQTKSEYVERTEIVYRKPDLSTPTVVGVV